MPQATAQNEASFAVASINPLGAIAAGFILERTSVLTTILFLAAWYLMLAIVSTLNGDVRHSQVLGRRDSTRQV